MPARILIYMVAGEASGDRLGAGLMKALTASSGGQVHFAGIGGERMHQAGLVSLFPMRELSLMGFLEILPHLPRLMRRLRQTSDDIMAAQPEGVVTIDSPGFAFRLAEDLRSRGYRGKLIHYVAPSVWAYRPGRAKKTARLYDHMLALLPFEPAYFEREGLGCTFVGHPAVHEYRHLAAQRSVESRRRFAQAHGLSESATFLCVLPGSRNGELRRHLPVFKEAIALLLQDYPRLVTILAVPPAHAQFVQDACRNWPAQNVVISEEQAKQQAFLSCDAGLVKSGTVALEAALASLPMVVAYKVNPMTAWLMRRLSRTRFYSLVNITAQRPIIPELLQEDCEPVKLYRAVRQLLSDPVEARRQTVDAQAALAQLGSIGPVSPSERAAQAVLAQIAL